MANNCGIISRGATRGTCDNTIRKAVQKSRGSATQWLSELAYLSPRWPSSLMTVVTRDISSRRFIFEQGISHTRESPAPHEHSATSRVSNGARPRRTEMRDLFFGCLIRFQLTDAGRCARSDDRNAILMPSPHNPYKSGGCETCLNGPSRERKVFQRLSNNVL